MKIVCDASPLIFLCKIRRLELLSVVLKGQLLIPDDVQRELLAPPIPPAEEELLKTFLKQCRVVRIRPRGFRSAALSTADRTVLTLAVREKADRIVCDDRLLRDLAEVEGIRPIGTLGILLVALRENHLTAEETRIALDDLVGEHGFRIGVELYEATMAAIDDLAR